MILNEFFSTRFFFRSIEYTMNFTVFLCVYILSESVLVRGDKYQMHIMQNSSYNCRLQIVIELEFKIKLRFRENNKTALTCLLQFEQDSNSYCIHLEQSHATITMASDSTTRGKVGKQSFISLAILNFFSFTRSLWKWR